MDWVGRLLTHNSDREMNEVTQRMELGLTVRVDFPVGARERARAS